MKIAVVHYHLQPGGVTRVVENTLAAFARQDLPHQFAALAGRPYLGNLIENVAVVEGLDYAAPENAPAPETLADRLEDAARATLGSPPDLWHVHNHSLGKNPALPPALALLAERGHALLLHLHDFAEDGRPDNHRALAPVLDRLYPAGSRIRYAALNRRDHRILADLAAGHAPPPLLLPNSIPAPPAEPSTASAPAPDLPPNLHLYPVRAVRRKNLGELALLAAAHPDLHFANSLGPTNPAFRPTYRRWQTFARDLALPLTYGIGDDSPHPFPRVVAASQALVTTSVAEGFGLGFLEPWTFGKALLGRDLPPVTSDFADARIDLSHLYARLDLPAELLPSDANLDDRLRSALDDLHQAYRRPLPPDALQQARASILRDGKIDFGRLDEPLQEHLVSTVADTPELAASIRRQANLAALPQHRIDSNAQAIRRHYSPQAYAQKLAAAYDELAASPAGPVTYPDPQRLLTQFLHPENLNLLRT